MVNATTLTRVKRAIPVEPSTVTTYDAILNDIIAAVSKEIETFIGYELLLAQRTERYHVNLHDSVVFLRVIPVVTVDEVKASVSLWDFATATALTADTDYRARVGTGEVYFPHGILSSGFEALQVKYTAGLGATDAAVVAAAPDLAWAADLQVAEDFRRRQSPGSSSTPGPKGEQVFTGAARLLPRAQELLSQYRRILLTAPSPAPPGF